MTPQRQRSSIFWWVSTVIVLPILLSHFFGNVIQLSEQDIKGAMLDVKRPEKSGHRFKVLTITIEIKTMDRLIG